MSVLRLKILYKNMNQHPSTVSANLLYKNYSHLLQGICSKIVFTYLLHLSLRALIHLNGQQPQLIKIIRKLSLKYYQQHSQQHILLGNQSSHKLSTKNIWLTLICIFVKNIPPLSFLAFLPYLIFIRFYIFIQFFLSLAQSR